jgi:hypothetical protein
MAITTISKRLLLAVAILVTGERIDQPGNDAHQRDTVVEKS